MQIDVADFPKLGSAKLLSVSETDIFMTQCFIEISVCFSATPPLYRRALHNQCFRYWL